MRPDSDQCRQRWNFDEGRATRLRVMRQAHELSGVSRLAGGGTTPTVSTAGAAASTATVGIGSIPAAAGQPQRRPQRTPHVERLEWRVKPWRDRP